MVRFPALTHPDQLSALAARMTDEQIAAHLGCAIRSVREARHRFKIPHFGHTTYRTCNPQKDIGLRELAALVERMSDEKIAAHIGCSPTTVRRLRNRFNIPRSARVEPEVRGELPVLRETPVILSCPACRWTHSTMAAAVRGAWQLDFDSKLRQEGRRVFHVPCGSAMRIYFGRPSDAAVAR